LVVGIRTYSTREQVAENTDFSDLLLNGIKSDGFYKRNISQIKKFAKHARLRSFHPYWNEKNQDSLFTTKTDNHEDITFTIKGYTISLASQIKRNI